MSSNVISLVNVPYQLEWRGCPAYEMGDYIQIVETDNTTKYIYYLNETLTYNGGLSASSSWESVESGNVEGTRSISQVIGKTQAKVDKVNREISLLVEEQAEINGEITTLRSELRQTASGFEQYVEDEVNGLRSEVNQTVSGINQTITNTKNELQSEIDQTESSLSSRITSQGNTITEIRQDLDGINLTYNSTNGTASITIGDITVNNLVNGEYVDKQVAGIELDGYVKFNDLSTSGSTTINGSNITTGTISANRINMTGAVDWSDLSSGCRSTITGLVSDVDLPDYIQSTYIDATTIQSPTIIGGSLTSTMTGSDGNTHKTIIEDSQVKFRIKETGSTGTGSFEYTVGYIDAYANDTGMPSSARTGLRIESYSDGSTYSGGLSLIANRGLVLQSKYQDIFFYIPGYSTTTLSSILDKLENTGSGGTATAVFG